MLQCRLSILYIQIQFLFSSRSGEGLLNFGNSSYLNTIMNVIRACFANQLYHFLHPVRPGEKPSSIKLVGNVIDTALQSCRQSFSNEYLSAHARLIQGTLPVEENGGGCIIRTCLGRDEEATDTLSLLLNSLKKTMLNLRST